MKRTINKWEFRDAFRDMGRGGQFSYYGLDALFDYLEEYEDSTDKEIELDVIALCCDYSEYATALEAAREYGIKEEVAIDEYEDAKELEEIALDWLNDRTAVITFDGGIIIQGF